MEVVHLFDRVVGAHLYTAHATENVPKLRVDSVFVLDDLGILLGDAHVGRNDDCSVLIVVDLVSSSCSKNWIG